MVITRLWSYQLLEKLPRQQLLGQWRECIALLGKGWGKKHSVVNYVFKYPDEYLLFYAHWVFWEMVNRRYSPNYDCLGKALSKRYLSSHDSNQVRNKLSAVRSIGLFKPDERVVYPEHNETYLKECVENLKRKGVDIDEKVFYSV